jgi:hypothetical protein
MNQQEMASGSDFASATIAYEEDVIILNAVTFWA